MSDLAADPMAPAAAGGTGLRALYRTAAALTLTLVFAACGDAAKGGDPAGRPLLVMAATSLNVAMPALAERFEAETGTPVTLSFGSTGNLAAQIENGAPADLYFSADEITVQRLAGTGLVRPGDARIYATGRLALVTRAGVPLPETPLPLTEARFEVVAIANPDLAPYGAAAREVFRRMRIWEVVRPRIVQGENVAQAYQLVQTGNADAAIVALSVLPAGAEHTLIDAGLHPPIRQAAAVLARSSHPRAAAFLDFVTSEAGQAILTGHGFGPIRQ